MKRFTAIEELVAALIVAVLAAAILASSHAFIGFYNFLPPFD